MDCVFFYSLCVVSSVCAGVLGASRDACDIPNILACIGYVQL